jgi:two-component system response regulator LytT
MKTDFLWSQFHLLTLLINLFAMKILLIEDEDAAIRRLEKLLNEMDPTVEIAGRLDSVEASVQWLKMNPSPDLILMDIHLADGSSFEVFEHVDIKCPVVFTTAYDEYAIKAFKVNAVDYLMKPIKQTELEHAVRKVKEMQQNTPVPDYSELAGKMNQTTTQYLRRILVKLGQSIRLVDTDDVAYFYTRDKITFLITKSTAKRYPMDYPLDRLEKMVDPSQFYRINRQFIVHIGAIKEMHPYSKSRIKVDLEPASDMEIIVSTEKASNFKQWLVGMEEE